MGAGSPPREVVHVWHAAPALASPPGSRRACLELLDPGERERLGQFRFEADGEAYLAAHALLRSALSRLAPVHPRSWRFRGGSHGKPFVDAPAPHRYLAFSLSHTAGRVAVAVARSCVVGIDVESAGPGRSVLENPEWYLSPSETRGLEALAPAKRTERFFALWTLKEAFLKASGMGLAARPQALSFELDQHRSPAVSFSPAIREEPCDWQFFALAASERHPLAVAARRPLGGDVELHVHEARQIPLPPQDGAASHGG